MTEEGVGGTRVWNEGIPGKDIPGSTRIPVAEIDRFFQGNTNNLQGLDLGSGKGRSAKVLEASLRGSTITALDLSLEGLRLTETKNKVQAQAEDLPFPPNRFDFVNVCGVLTNLVDENPKTAQQLRTSVVSGLYRVIKPGGCVVISDFGSEHLLDAYDVNYERHALITGERGTIAVLKSGENFIGKSNEAIAAMKGTSAIVRYAHHYACREVVDLLHKAGFNVLTCTIEIAQTPTGHRPIDNLIVLAKKPQIENATAEVG